MQYWRWRFSHAGLNPTYATVPYRRALVDKNSNVTSKLGRQARQDVMSLSI